MTDKLTPEEFYDLRNKWKGFDNVEMKLETVKDKVKCFKIINTLEEKKVITPNKSKALRSYVKNDFKVKVDPVQRLIKQLQKNPNKNDSSIYLSLDICKQKLARKNETIVNLNSLITQKQKTLAKHKVIQKRLQDEHFRLTKQAELFETILKTIPTTTTNDDDVDEDDISDINSDEDEVGDVEHSIQPLAKKSIPTAEWEPITEAE